MPSIKIFEVPDWPTGLNQRLAYKLVLTQSGRKTYISFNSQFWKMQQKLPKWAKSIKPCWNEAILILFAPKCFVEFSVKSLMPFEVIQKYWKLKEKQFLPLGVVVKKAKGKTRYPTISCCFGSIKTRYLVLKTLLSCLSEKTLWKVDSEGLYRKQGCMKSR